MVEHDLVSLGFFHGLQCLRVGIALDLVQVVDSEFPRGIFGLHDFVEDFLFQQLVIQLCLLRGR